MTDKIRTCRESVYVKDSLGRSDAGLVNKVNELVGVVNRQQKDISELKRQLAVVKDRQGTEES